MMILQREGPLCIMRVQKDSRGQLSLRLIRSCMVFQPAKVYRFLEAIIVNNIKLL